jgi:uncharacterized protein (TIGR02145 family)
MAENLNYNATDSECYDDLDSNCEKWGRLYNWATAMALPSNCNTSTCSNQIQSPHQGICPEGWHLPSSAEWTALEDFAVSYRAATKLKATTGWNSRDGFIEDANGTDNYGFSALPSGSSDYGDYAQWWSATGSNASQASYRSMNDNATGVFTHNGDKSYLLSVRCLKDN